MAGEELVPGGEGPKCRALHVGLTFGGCTSQKLEWFPCLPTTLVTKWFRIEKLRIRILAQSESTGSEFGFPFFGPLLGKVPKG